ncbi:glycosyltransferase family 2 protein [Bacteroides sp.]|uniref:glycosyltransferase family 2 protein n=1 Tax=Bacteroides sp. TaxID=29523 RepID=UPI0023C016B7|nr:glycosyltransferase family 2 protein [Bacteroides sp.]MDE6215502.1 glycosyltransferase [Bacteroides sp.]
MKVSIIIPIYNVSTYIKNCLESVWKQPYQNLEVILVDDCGTDNSMEIVQEYLECHDFAEVKIIRHTHNRGLSAARNTGLEAATGDYVYFLDSDDELKDDCIPMMTDPLENQCYDFVIGNYEVVGSNKEYPALTLPKGTILNNKEILHSYAEGRWYMMAWNKLCRRDFLLSNDLFFEEGVLHEDVIWSFKLACKANFMYVLQKPTYRYTIRAASIMTGTDIERDANQYIKVFKVITRFIVNEGKQNLKDEYSISEGRKSTLLYSLLQRKEYNLYNHCYFQIHGMSPISPWIAFKSKTIGIKYLLRDLHYLLPVVLGRQYKRLFYNLYYKWRGKPIEGALW